MKSLEITMLGCRVLSPQQTNYLVFISKTLLPIYGEREFLAFTIYKTT